MKKILIWICFGAMASCAGCGQDDSVCSADQSFRHLKYDFGYELVADATAPQLILLSVKEEKKSKNMVWCSARAELRGQPSELVRALQLRTGMKRWHRMENYLADLNVSTLNSNAFKQIKSSLALFLLSVHKNEMHSTAEYTIPVHINYVLKKNGNMEHVEYSSDLNLNAFTMLKGEINLSTRERKLADKITK